MLTHVSVNCVRQKLEMASLRHRLSGVDELHVLRASYEHLMNTNNDLQTRKATKLQRHTVSCVHEQAGHTNDSSQMIVFAVSRPDYALSTTALGFLGHLAKLLKRRMRCSRDKDSQHKKGAVTRQAVDEVSASPLIFVRL